MMTYDEPRDIHDRCLAWGAWARCVLPGESTTAEGYLRERLDHAHEGIPSPEVAQTERAVARMKVSRKAYWPVFARYYLNPTELSEEEISRLLLIPEPRVNAMLRQARMLVGYYLQHTEIAA